jgi:hypothetical protein
LNIDPEHIVEARKALSDYLSARSPRASAQEWHACLREARRIIAAALRASKYLTNVEGALKASGAHAAAFRHLLAPPMSQDQLSIQYPGWNKRLENFGLPVPAPMASDLAGVFYEWLDRSIAPWLDQGRQPNRAEITNLFLRTASLIASQRILTKTRTDFARKQESAVVELLMSKGWTRIPSKLIDTRAAVPSRHFMHKTRFATATTTHQEVDIACGLRGTYVLAMECKVTNDVTNSVKRVNDVLKKAAAWKAHWGSFVHTAAVLQGVIAPKDVQRLTDASVLVFWSHDLSKLALWLDTNA